MAAEKSVWVGFLGALFAFSIVMLVLSNSLWWLRSFELADKYHSLRSGTSVECRALDAAIKLLGTITRGSNREAILDQANNTDSSLLFQHANGDVEWAGIYFTFDERDNLSQVRRTTPRTCTSDGTSPLATEGSQHE
jgi:hypothetical protein